MKKGKLYLIPNFLGHTPWQTQFPLWNAEVVKTIQVFYVENAKPARALLKALHPEVNLNEVELIVHDKHARNRWEGVKEVLDNLNNGKDVGLISDAGCPGVADPGSEIIRIAHKENIEVVPMIGPSSILLTLMASGLHGQHFSFAGYLPKEADKRLLHIKQMSRQAIQGPHTFLWIETPYRNEAIFKEVLNAADSSLSLCLGIDIFSPAQQILTDTIGGWKKRKAPSLKDRQVVYALGN